MKPNRKIYLSILIFGILIILLANFLIYPLFVKIKKLAGDYLSQKEKLILIAEERKNLNALKEVFKNYRSELNKIEKAFVNPEAPIEFINFLEESAEVSGIKLEIFSMTPVREKDSPAGLSVQLSLTGPFSNFLEFLEKLETSPYLIEILDLNAKRLTLEKLKSEKFKDFSPGDVQTSLLLKVHTK